MSLPAGAQSCVRLLRISDDALQCDPVEKKPFFHVYPGSDALTFGMMGCDFHCPYCQNWVTSQALRDEASRAPIRLVTAEQLVGAARALGSRLVVSNKMSEPRHTRAADLIRACEIGAAEGLHFIYAGNLPGRVGQWENTRCPGCGETLIEHYGYLVRAYKITAEGKCPVCSRALPGVWPSPEEVRTGDSMAEYCARLPRPVFMSPPL
jgi:hypothetical protein